MKKNSSQLAENSARTDDFQANSSHADDPCAGDACADGSVARFYERLSGWWFGCCAAADQAALHARLWQGHQG
jgi:hypothetical protein